MRRLQPDGPRLGLASTRELLEELLARMETSDIAYSYDVLLAVRAFLRDAPPALLDYRTGGDCLRSPGIGVW